MITQCEVPHNKLKEKDRVGRGGLSFWDGSFCRETKDGYHCTKQLHHTGDHVAHDCECTAVAYWPSQPQK